MRTPRRIGAVGGHTLHPNRDRQRRRRWITVRFAGSNPARPVRYAVTVRRGPWRDGPRGAGGNQRHTMTETSTDGGNPVNDELPAPDERTPRNAMGEHNPEEWDPDPDAFESGEVNIWDPVAHEGFNEPGHWADRDPDMDELHARRLALRGEFDGADHLPLLRSDMRGVPTEGVQGSYARVIRLDDGCPECGADYGVHVCASTLGGVHMEECLVCEYVIHQA